MESLSIASEFCRTAPLSAFWIFCVGGIFSVILSRLVGKSDKKNDNTIYIGEDAEHAFSSPPTEILSASTRKKNRYNDFILTGEEVEEDRPISEDVTYVSDPWEKAKVEGWKKQIRNTQKNVETLKRKVKHMEKHALRIQRELTDAKKEGREFHFQLLKKSANRILNFKDTNRLHEANESARE